MLGFIGFFSLLPLIKTLAISFLFHLHNTRVCHRFCKPEKILYVFIIIVVYKFAHRKEHNNLPFFWEFRRSRNELPEIQFAKLKCRLCGLIGNFFFVCLLNTWKMIYFCKKSIEVSSSRMQRELNAVKLKSMLKLVICILSCMDCG